MTRAVVFDIGRVLVEWHPERPYDADYGQAHREAFFAAVDVHGMNAEIDRVDDPSDIVADWAARHPDWAREIEAWHGFWIRQIGPEIGGTVAIMERLRAARVPVHALSNFNAANFARAEARWPFLTDFDRQFISGRLGLIKPEPAIYAHVEAATGLSGDQLFFIDDMPDNIEAARARGWTAHLFEGPEGLAARLEAEGLL